MEQDPYTTKSQIKVWCDGCYDMVHFGHANLFRQAKSLGDYLIVGVHSDEEIQKHKGSFPVYTLEERKKMIESLKWVDEVVTSPYITTNSILDKYNCDICCHGDDITTTSDGIDTYDEIKKTRRFREVERTAGISTTQLMKKVLKMSHNSTTDESTHTTSPWTGSTFLLTTRKIAQFSYGKPPKSKDKIVYVPGDFDLFHIGHVELLKKARSFGDYLIVGVYTDSIVGDIIKNDPNYPIMPLQQRVLNVLACKYVSEVVFGAPYIVTKDLMDHLNVDLVVVNGKFHVKYSTNILDPFTYPKEIKKFILVDVESDVTTEKIIERIFNNREEFEKRNSIKEQKEMLLSQELSKNNL